MGRKRAGRASRKGGAAVTIIAEGTCLQGEIAAKGPLQLDGSLDGDLDAADAITVGPTGRLTGSLRGGEVRVAGSIEGEVVCRQLTIASGGRVYGDVLARSLVIDPGAVFLGTSRELDADASVPAASFDSAGSPSRDEEPEPSPGPSYSCVWSMQATRAGVPWRKRPYLCLVLPSAPHSRTMAGRCC